MLILLGNSNAIIDYRYADILRLVLDYNIYFFFLISIFNGIGEKVIEDLLDPPIVPLHLR